MAGKAMNTEERRGFCDLHEKGLMGRTINGKANESGTTRCVGQLPGDFRIVHRRWSVVGIMTNISIPYISFS